MPNNTDDNPYSAWERPVSNFHCISTGDQNDDTIPKPYLYVATRPDGTWITDVTNGQITVEVNGTVRDPVANMMGPSIGTIEINGNQVQLSTSYETPTWGRRMARVGAFSFKLNVSLGIQVVKVSVSNSLNGYSERLFLIEVNDEHNDLRNPTNVKTTVRPIGRVSPPSLPHIQYLYAEGTNLGNVITPSSFLAYVNSLEPLPSVQVKQNQAQFMRHLHTSSPNYASRAFITVREDLAASISNPPREVIIIPLGGRLEWETSNIPNILGPIELINRRQRDYTKITLLRKTPTGNWENPTHLQRGDIITVRATRYSGPDDPFMEIPIRFSDPNRSSESFYYASYSLKLARTVQGKYSLQSYSTDNWMTSDTATEIELLVSRDLPNPSPSVADLRIHDSGRILVGTNDNFRDYDIDLPCFVKPARFQRNGVPLDQEPLPDTGLLLGAGNSIIPGTGEFVFKVVDRRILGRGVNMIMKRTYRIR